MKRVFKIASFSVLAIAFFTLNACNTQSAKTTDNDQTEENIENLKEELRDVGQAIDQLAENENQDFKNEAQNIIDKFNRNIENFENKMKDSGEKIDDETQEKINDMKAKSNELEAKLDNLGDNTKENWNELKKEMKHDFSAFGSSIKDFFDDNV